MFKSYYVALQLSKNSRRTATCKRIPGRLEQVPTFDSLTMTHCAVWKSDTKWPLSVTKKLGNFLKCNVTKLSLCCILTDLQIVPQFATGSLLDAQNSVDNWTNSIHMCLIPVCQRLTVSCSGVGHRKCARSSAVRQGPSELAGDATLLLPLPH